MNSANASLIKTLIGHTNWVVSLTVLNDGTLASGSDDLTIKLWDINTGIVLKTLTGHTAYIWDLKVLEKGDLASCSFDQTIKVWNTNAGVVKVDFSIMR